MTQDTHIQIHEITPRIQYTADGRQTAFVYPFPIFEDGDLEVFIGDERQSSGFTITGARDSRGGRLNFTRPPPDQAVITLRRHVPVKRTTDFQEGGAFRAKVINDELDRMTAQIQQIEVEAKRGLKFLPSDAAEGLTLPSDERRRGKLLGFDAQGQPIAEITPGDVKAAKHRAREAVAAHREAEVARDQAANERQQARRYRSEARDARDEARRYRSEAREERDEARQVAQLANVISSSTDQAKAGTDNTTIMTPLRVRQTAALKFSDRDHWHSITTPGDAGHYYPVRIGYGFSGDVVIRRHVSAEEELYGGRNGSLLFDGRFHHTSAGRYPYDVIVHSYRERGYTHADDRTPQFIAKVSSREDPHDSVSIVWLRGGSSYEIWQASDQPTVCDAQGRIAHGDTSYDYGVLDKDFAVELSPGEDSSNPAGRIMIFAAARRPSGWLPCHGAALAQSRYWRLFQVIGHTYALSSDDTDDKETQFRLPDLRGLFLRGHDPRSSGSIDAGRVFGSQQEDAFKRHRHQLGIPQDAYGVGDQPALIGTYGLDEGIRFQHYSDYQGGNETRPVNMALGFFIKY